jgi:hypothetical protein
MQPRSVLFALLWATLWLAAWSPMSAQQQVALAAVFPRNGATDISPHVTFTGASYRPLDRTSLTLGSVLFIEEAIALRTHPSRWTKHGTLVQPAPKGDHLFTATPHGLKHGTAYRCRVMGLRAFETAPSGAVTTVALPPLEVAFTTSSAVPEYAGWSVDVSGQIRCDEAITVRYNTSLTDFQPLPADIITVERADPAAPDGFAVLPIEQQYAPDGRSITIRARTGWIPGDALRLSSRLDHVTGNPIARRTEFLRVRNTTSVQANAVSSTSASVPSDIASAVQRNANVVRAGSDLLLSAPSRSGSWEFVRWESEDVPSLHGATASDVRLPLPCSLLQAQLRVRAVYVPRDTIDVVLSTNEYGSLEVRNAAMQVIATITTDTTLRVSRTQPLYVSALPVQGYRFASWNSTMAAINGSTAGTVQLGGGALVGTGGQNTPAMNPVFVPTPGWTPMAELYRLRGDIVDEDNDVLHRVDNNVIFTTEREFEDGNPVQRMLCVSVTSRNWELTGYTIAATGQTVRYDQPQREACVAADLTRPINIVTFFARRIPLSLRVDRVLLKTNDVSTIIRGRDPHHEARSALDIREAVRGVATWRGLAAVACHDDANDIIFDSYMIKAGDVVRFRTTDAPQRAQAWTTYAPVQAYLVPPNGALEDGWYTSQATIDRDHARFATSSCEVAALPQNEVRVRACWRQQFGVEAIALRILTLQNGKREDARFVERWFDPETYADLQADEPAGGRQLEYVPGYGTIIKVRFTGPIDVQPVYNGAITMRSESNVVPTDPLLRDLDFTTATSQNGNTTFLPANGDPITTVEMRVADLNTTPRLQALPFGQIMTTCTRDVLSLEGDPLMAAYSFVLRTVELPAHGLFLNSVGLTYDGDDDIWPFVNNGDIYHGLMGGYVLDKSYRGLDAGFHRLPNCTVQSGRAPDECTVDQSDKDAPYNWGDHIALFEPFNMQERDVIHHSIITYDEDCKDENDCLVNRLDDLLASAKKAFAKGDAKDLVNFAADFVATLLPADEQDEYLGSASIIESINSKWGAAKDGSRTIRLYGQNSWYDYRSRLYPLKQILR